MLLKIKNDKDANNGVGVVGEAGGGGSINDTYWDYRKDKKKYVIQTAVQEKGGELCYTNCGNSPLSDGYNLHRSYTSYNKPNYSTDVETRVY